MKQATVNLPSGTYTIMEVEKGHRSFSVYDNELISSKNSPFDSVWDSTQLPPPGNWQLLFTDPLKPTEEEAGEIVTEYHFGSNRWINYLDAATWYHSPTASLDSLAWSLGISKPFVILKLKTDNNDNATTGSNK